MCQRSRNVPTTYGQCYAERVSHTLAYVEKFQAWKICLTARRTTTYSSVLRRMPAYYGICQRALNVYKLTPNIFDVCQRFSQIFHTSGIRWLNRQGVTGPLPDLPRN